MKMKKTRRVAISISRSMILALLFFLASLTALAQKYTGSLKVPAIPTHIDVKERTIQDLLYFPFTCINAYMPTKDIAIQEITDTFGTCEIINGNPGLHAGEAFNFTYRGVTIGICDYCWQENKTWYYFFFKTKKEADKFYNDIVRDIRGAGIPLTKDKIYGSVSNRKRPVSVFKWVFVDLPVKVKEASGSNIETADVVGMYKIEVGVYKKNRQR